MRILVMVGMFPKLSETFILNQITGLIDRGHDVSIHARARLSADEAHPDVFRYGLLDRVITEDSPSGRISRPADLVRRWGRTGFARPREMVRLANPLASGRPALPWTDLEAALPLLRAEPFDVVHCHFGPLGRTAARLKQAGVLTGRLVVSFHGFDVNSYVKRNGPDVYRRMFPWVDLCTANSGFTADKVRRLGGKRIEVLPVGLHMDRFEFREKTAFPGEPVRLISVARLVEQKGLHHAIEAVARLAPSHPELRYDIVGDGPYRPRLEARIAELGVGDRVSLLGWKGRDEVVDLYRRSHLFVFPCATAADGDTEGQGLVLQEAQASGLPVLTTRHGAIPDGVTGESAFLVPEGDVDALAERLGHLLDHPEVWPEMGRAGRRYVERRYDIERLNDRLVALYEGLLEEPPKTARISR
ncbi:MAG: glycosyltransferase [Myxococcota bacterium]